MRSPFRKQIGCSLSAAPIAAPRTSQDACHSPIVDVRAAPEAASVLFTSSPYVPSQVTACLASAESENLGMSSDDDYYVELYERHAEARKGRRARRRGSGGNGTSAGRRGLDKYRGHKTRRSRGWLLQSSMRIAGVVFIAAIAAYELYLFRQPGSDSSATNGIIEKLSVAADEEGSYVKSIRHPLDESESGIPADNTRTATMDEAALPPLPAGHGMASLKVNTNSSETASRRSHSPSLPKDANAKSIQTEAKEKAKAVDTANSKLEVPGYAPLKRRNLERSTGTDNSRGSQDEGKTIQNSRSKGTKKSNTGGETEASKKKMGLNEEQNTDIDGESADSETGSKEGQKEESSQEKRKSPIGRDRGAKKETDSIEQRGTEPKKHTGPAGDVGSEPGAKENFWKWFQESKVTEGTGASSVECPEENHKLCQMFYKYARKYKIRSIFDASCGKNLAWMSVPLRKISNELWGFKYHCGEPDPTRMIEARETLKEFSFVEFDDRKWWKSGFPEDVELLFAWDTLAHTAFGRVWSFFVNVRKQDIKWVLVDNYPAIMNDPSPKRQYINLRKHPFRFPAATAVVQDVREVGEADTVKRQLLLYEGSALPDNLG